MRCLYCGKELALLKRWTGGGEFCSDAHRQQYQEEYNQLALNRLLQAKPQAEVKKAEARAAEAKLRDAKPTDAKIRDAKTKDTAPAPVQLEAPAAPPVVEPRPTLVVEAGPGPQPAAAAVVAPVAAPETVELAMPEPELARDEPEIDEDPGPAEAYGFFLELPIPVDVPVAASAGELGGFDQPIPPALPSRDAVSQETALVAAGQVFFAPCARVMDYVVPSGERRLEVREFVRSFPVVQVDLAPAGETGLLQTSEESMDIEIFPQPPQSSPPVWQENAAPFGFGYELGALARVSFRTTGLEDKDEDQAPMPVEAEPEQLVEPVVEQIAEQTSEPALVTKPTVVETTAIVEPPAPAIRVKAVALPIAKPAFARPAPVAATSVKTPGETLAREKSDPVVGMITKPLPLTLHGLAAGRGKPVQVFQTAVAGELDIQVPRLNALPLRPVMTLGPAALVVPPAAKTEDRKPSERTVLVKPDPRKSPTGRPDPRFANGKNRKPDTRPEPEVPAPVIATTTKASPAPPPERVKPAAANIAPVTPVPAEPKIDTPRPPEPFARPAASLDLGLPKLTLDSGGFWSKLPPAGKIGIAAAVVLAIVGVAILALRGSGSTVVANGPQVVAGSPLPAMESGWITDWGAEPGVRREREISILRPSLNLSDYRIEFQAQMEGKAIGWVFRAKDSRNFYVAKLEVVTPGLEPKVDVVHFAVVDGQTQTRAKTELPMKVRIDTVYRIRFDAVGDHFSTWVQDEKVDDWTDDRLKIGGVGLYSDRGETMPRPRTVSVVPLVIKR